MSEDQVSVMEGRSHQSSLLSLPAAMVPQLLGQPCVDADLAPPPVGLGLADDKAVVHWDKAAPDDDIACL